MKLQCEMRDKKKAQLQISFTHGEIHHLCFRHSFSLIKAQLPRAARTGLGIFIQRIPVDRKHEINPLVRSKVTTPEDREHQQAERVQEDPWDW